MHISSSYIYNPIYNPLSAFSLILYTNSDDLSAYQSADWILST